MEEPRTEEEVNRRANEKARKRKAARDRILATKTIEKGLLIVHTGKGKGKSTAAFGLVARAIGNGLRVGVVQYVKGKWQTGERTVLERFPDQVDIRTMGEGFTWETQDRARDIRAAAAAWETSKEMIEACRGEAPPLRPRAARRAQHRPSLRLPVARRGLRVPRRSPLRAPRGGDRPERETRASRHRGHGHRDDHGQTPLPGRGEGPEGNRVLSPVGAGLPRRPARGEHRREERGGSAVEAKGRAQILRPEVPSSVPHPGVLDGPARRSAGALRPRSRGRPPSPPPASPRSPSGGAARRGRRRGGRRARSRPGRRRRRPRGGPPRAGTGSSSPRRPPGPPPGRTTGSARPGGRSCCRGC